MTILYAQASKSVLQCTFSIYKELRGNNIRNLVGVSFLGLEGYIIQYALKQES